MGLSLSNLGVLCVGNAQPLTLYLSMGYHIICFVDMVWGVLVPYYLNYRTYIFTFSWLLEYSILGPLAPWGYEADAITVKPWRPTTVHTSCYWVLDLLCSTCWSTKLRAEVHTYTEVTWAFNAENCNTMHSSALKSASFTQNVVIFTVSESVSSFVGNIRNGYIKMLRRKLRYDRRTFSKIVVSLADIDELARIMKKLELQENNTRPEAESFWR